MQAICLRTRARVLCRGGCERVVALDWQVVRFRHLHCSGSGPRRLAVALALSLVATVAAAADYRLLTIEGHRLKWGAPDMGTGAEVSYGFALAAEDFPDAVNCGRLAPMDLMAEAWGNDPARLARIAADAFAMWSLWADVRFRPAAAGEAPDILIGAQGAPRRIAFANVWHDTAAARDGVAPLTRATICFNPAIRWAADATPGANDLGTVLAHEIGHAIGLDHPGATGALMGFQNQGDINALMPGDIAGAVALYGARPAD